MTEFTRLDEAVQRRAGDAEQSSGFGLREEARFLLFLWVHVHSTAKSAKWTGSQPDDTDDVLLTPADHRLTEDEIRVQFGGLVRAGVEAFRTDLEYTIALAEAWAARHRAPTPLTREQREIRAMERHRQAELTRELNAARDKILREAFAAGRVSTDVSQEVGISASSVLLKWREMGLQAAHRPRTHHGNSGRPRSALTDHREQVVRQHFDEGLTQEQSASILGISQSGVSLIRIRLGLKTQH
ncbi:hypothetical protein [Aeromicrobium sp.]|uniref:hypothetical protein n=1 Tax=Aeromicrobium sp. TaxID=1871063 RepID=UPI0030C06E29